MCDGVIDFEGLKGRCGVEVVPRGRVLKDGEIARHDHPQGTCGGGEPKRPSGWGIGLDLRLGSFTFDQRRRVMGVAIRWKNNSSQATATDGVGPSFYARGLHLQRLGVSVPLDEGPQEEIRDVIARRQSSVIPTFEGAAWRVVVPVRGHPICCNLPGPLLQLDPRTPDRGEKPTAVDLRPGPPIARL